MGTRTTRTAWILTGAACAALIAALALALSAPKAGSAAAPREAAATMPPPAREPGVDRADAPGTRPGVAPEDPTAGGSDGAERLQGGARPTPGAPEAIVPEAATASGGLSRASALLHVLVSAETGGGGGVASARVRVHAAGSESALVVARDGGERLATVWETDGSGRVALRVPAERSLTVVASGDPETTHASGIEVAGLAAGAEESVTVTLRARRRLRFHGLVTAEEDGRPLAGAVVRAGGDASGRERWTDALGSFVVELARWPCEGWVEVEGRPPVRVALGPRHEYPGNALPIRVPRWAAVDVRLTAFRGEPVDLSGIELTLVQASARTPQPSDGAVRLSAASPEPLSARTEENGRVVFETVLPRRASLLGVSRGGRRLVVVPLLGQLPGERREVEVPLSVGLQVTGLLRDPVSGEAVPGHGVWLVAHAPERVVDQGGYLARDAEPVHVARTDEAGRFVLRDVQPGRWWIGVAPDAERSSKATLLDLTGGGREVVVEAARGLAVRGSVFVPEGSLPAGTVVSVGPPDGPTRLRTRVAEDGTFELRPLAPGRAILVATPPERSGWVATAFQTRAGERVRVELCPANALSGRVVDDSGAPLDGRAWLAPNDADAWPGAAASAVVCDGRIHFEDLPGVTWDLFFRTPDGWFARAEAIDGLDAGRLVAVEGAELVVAELPERERVSRWTLRWRNVPVGELESGRRLRVPEGELAIYRLWDPWNPVRRVRSAGGGELRVDLGDTW